MQAKSRYLSLIPTVRWPTSERSVVRAIVWKEFREQGIICLTLVVLGAGVLLAVATQAKPGVQPSAPGDVLQFLGFGRVALLMLSVTAGMVCGGAVFAAEREAGTMIFLESLPTTQGRIWRAKFLAGALLTVLQVGALIAVAVVLNLVPSAGWVISVLIYSLLAFVWGLFGSTLAQTTLGSIGVALPGATFCTVLALIPVILFFQSPGTNMLRPTGGLVFLAIMFILPIVSSAWLFTRSDRERGVGDARHPGLGLHALYWLVFRQSLQPALALTAFALFIGLSFLAPGVQPFLYWPGAALLAGALSGGLAFADEHSHGSSRFWSEQRLPLGRVWLFKILLHFALMIWLLIALAAPLFVRSQFAHAEGGSLSYGRSILSIVFGTTLFDELGRQGWRYLLLPAVYGFAAGQLCCMFFRKLVVACAAACLIGSIGTIFWGPSLLAGGVMGWQLWLAPFLVLLTGRLLMRAWTADRLLTRQPMGILLASGLATVLITAWGIAYRVLEIPDSPSGEDDVRYVAQIISLEDNVSGRDFKTAAERYSNAVSAVSPQFDKAGAEPPAPPGGSRFRHAEERLQMVPYLGWPINDANLDGWLDRMFSQKSQAADDKTWHAIVAAAAARPLGIYEHPMLIGPQGVSGSSLEYGRRMCVALLARGLQLQARGDSTAFPAAFRSVITVGRTMRNGSVVTCMVVGIDIERIAFMAMNHWLQNLPPTAVVLKALCQPLPPPLTKVPVVACEFATAREDVKLIRSLLDFLEPLDPTMPFDPTPQFLAERHVVREALKAPAQLLTQTLGLPTEGQGANDPVVELVGVAWAVPWERERTRRLVGLGFESGQFLDTSVTSGRPCTSTLLVMRSRSPEDLKEIDRQLRTHRRATLLTLALAAFRLERGKYPDGLGEVVAAGYLRRLPPDPYDDSRTFGYRLSPGEVLISAPRVPSERLQVTREEASSMAVLPGQAILWSVGPDRINQGGRNPPGQVIAGRPEDVVYLVPAGPTRQ